MSKIETATDEEAAIYGRAQTAIVMAKAEAWAMRAWLQRRSRKLREEADEIDAFLEKATKEVDSWYETIVRWNDEVREARRKAKSAEQL